MRLTVQVEPVEGSSLANGDVAASSGGTVAPGKRVCFLEIANGNETIHELCGSISARWAKLYPNRGALSIRKLQDGHHRDLDLSYRVNEVFTDTPSEPAESLVRVFITPPLAREDSVAPDSGLRPNQKPGKRGRSEILQSIEEGEEPSSKKPKTQLNQSNGASSSRLLFAEGVVNGVKDSQEANGAETSKKSKSKTSRLSVPASPPVASKASSASSSGRDHPRKASSIPGGEKQSVPATPSKRKVADTQKTSSKLPKHDVVDKSKISSSVPKTAVNGETSGEKSKPDTSIVDLTSGSEHEDADEPKASTDTQHPEQARAKERKAARKARAKGKNKDPEVLKQEATWELANHHVKAMASDGDTPNSVIEQSGTKSAKTSAKHDPIIVIGPPPVKESEEKKSARGRPSILKVAKQIVRPEMPAGYISKLVPISAGAGADSKQIQHAEETAYWANELSQTPSASSAVIRRIERRFGLAAAQIDKPIDEWTVDERRAIRFIDRWISEAEKNAAQRETQRLKTKVEPDVAETMDIDPKLPEAQPAVTTQSVQSHPAASAVKPGQKAVQYTPIPPPGNTPPPTSTVKPEMKAPAMATEDIAIESNPEVGLEAQMAIGSPPKPQKRSKKDVVPKESKKRKTLNPIPTPGAPVLLETSQNVDTSSGVGRDAVSATKESHEPSKKQKHTVKTKSPPLSVEKKETPVPVPNLNNKKATKSKIEHRSGGASSDGSSPEKAVYLSSDDESDVPNFPQEKIDAYRKEMLAQAKSDTQVETPAAKKSKSQKDKALQGDRPAPAVSKSVDGAEKPQKPSKTLKQPAKKLEPKGDFELASSRLKKEETASKQKVNNTPNNTQNGGSSLNIRPKGFVRQQSPSASVSTSVPSASRATSTSAAGATEDSSDEEASDSSSEDDKQSSKASVQSSSGSFSDSESDVDLEDPEAVPAPAQTPAQAKLAKGKAVPPPKQAESRSTPAPAKKTKAASALAGHPSLSELASGSRSQSLVRSTPAPPRPTQAQRTPVQHRVVGQVLKNPYSDDSSSSDDDSSSSSSSDSDSDSEPEKTIKPKKAASKATDNKSRSDSSSEIDPDLHPSRNKHSNSGAQGDSSQSQSSSTSAVGHASTPVGRSSFGGLKGWWSASKQ